MEVLGIVEDKGGRKEEWSESNREFLQMTRGNIGFIDKKRLPFLGGEKRFRKFV